MICVLQLLPVSKLGTTLDGVSVIRGGVGSCDSSRTSECKGGYENLSFASDVVSIARQDAHSTVSLSNSDTQVSGSKRSSETTRDWESIQAVFTRLYQDGNYKLKDVIRILATVYDFHAPVHMFKKRISDWGLTRSFTSAEKAKYAAMARKCVDLNESLPSHDEHGRRIPWDRVRRQVGRRTIPTKILPSHPSAKQMSERSQSVRFTNQRFINGQPDGTMMVNGHVAESKFTARTGVHIPSLTISSLHSRRIESILYHAREHFTWYSGTRVGQISHIQDHRAIRNTYAYAFDRLNLGLIKAATQSFMTAGQHVISAMRGHSAADFLCSLLCVIHRSFSCAIPAVAKVVLRFLVASSQENLGLYNPLTILLNNLSKLLGDVDDSRSSIPFRVLGECIKDNTQILLDEQNTKEVRYAAYFAQEEVVQVLRDEELYDEAGNHCQRLISSTVANFGLRSSMVMRAKCLMGWILLCQSRLKEAQNLLVELWQQWSQGSLYEVEDRAQEMCGVFPAFYLSVLYKEQGHTYSALYYRTKTFECSVKTYGLSHIWTLAHFRWLLHDLELVGEMAEITALKAKFPECYDQICSFEQSDLVVMD